VIRLIDGPAKGAYALERAPVYLRAVVGPDGNDCLDQLSDTPAVDERVYVYRQVKYSGPVHITMARPRRHVWTHIAEYEYLADVDAEAEQLRDSESWRAWAINQATATNAVGVPL
jgi:hypothetical protein